MDSTSLWGRGMTCTEISSPTRSAAAAPASVARLDRAHVAADHHSHQAAAHVLLADQGDVGRLDHGIGRLDGGHETLGLDHTQSLHHIRHL